MTSHADRITHDQTMSRLDVIATRLGRGEITPVQAEHESQEVLTSLQATRVVETERRLETFKATRPRNAVVYGAAALVTAGAALVYFLTQAGAE